jgi:shikimate dehydrogenase
LIQYGIIGNPLGHSYSERFFTDKFIREHINASYTPYALTQIDEVEQVLQCLSGFNVTYPYKESIIPYLDEIDFIANEIGAVNVVSKGKGYNTDWIGFRDSIVPLLIPEDKKALLLGTGGVSKAIQYALRRLNIDYTLVSRQASESAITYDNISQELLNEHSIIINCTPLGMVPYEKEKPTIPYKWLTSKHLLYDCIYNPDKTLFLQEGEKRGCQIKNGLEMLHRQADEAWIIWRQD